MSFFSLLIRFITHELAESGNRIEFLSISGHVGIDENEIDDQLVRVSFC